MVIDADCHISPKPEGITAEDLIQRLDVLVPGVYVVVSSA